jgi:hypothetical protein
MIVNFRARGISRGAHKLARTSTLNFKKKKKTFFLAPRCSCDMCELGIIKLIKLWTPLTGTSKAHVGMVTLQIFREHKSTLQDSGNWQLLHRKEK